MCERELCAAWLSTMKNVPAAAARFVAAEEAGASPRHQKAITSSQADDTVRTMIFSGGSLVNHYESLLVAPCLAFFSCASSACLARKAEPRTH